MTGRVDRVAAGLITEAVKQGVRRLIDMAEDKARMAAFIISRLEEPKKLGLDQERAAVVRAAALEAIGEWLVGYGGDIPPDIMHAGPPGTLAHIAAKLE